MNENNELIEQCIEKKRIGTDYSEIRKELQSQGLEKEEISHIIRKVDEVILKENITGGKKKYNKELKGIGLVLMLISGLIIFLTYSGRIDLKGKYFFAWAPLVLGYYIIVRTRIAEKRLKRDSERNKGK